jgi:hypothetical protein
MKKEAQFQVLSELERIFTHFNKGFFHNKLTVPAHVIQPDKKLIVRYAPESHHMVVGSKFSATSTLQMVSTYLHEMIHVNNLHNKVGDVTTNQYHNKEFLNGALAVGFYVTRHKSQGWSITTFEKPDEAAEYHGPSPAALVLCQKNLAGLNVDELLLDKGRGYLLGLSDGKRPRACFLKYICDCPPPYNSIRSGRRPDSAHAPHIVCKKCDSTFRMVED